MSGSRLLAPPTTEQRDALRATLLLAHDSFDLYRDCFARAGVTPQLVRADPPAALARLPVFDPAAVNRLASEALALRAHDLGGVELTSGTSGAVPKRRVLSDEDVRLDAALVTRLMRLAGVRAEDRVVAMDLSADPLSVAFIEGCERLGVRRSAVLAATGKLEIEPLVCLNPTVLIAPPALIARMAPALTQDCGPLALRLVIYNGDRLQEGAAAALRRRGIGLRSLYGLTETSALGVECSAERGVHLATTHALAEVRGAGRERELLVTTLGFSMPLLRYPTGDRVRVLRGRCPCGSPWPRVEVLGRTGDRFSLYDVKFTPEEFQALLLDAPEESLQIVLEARADGRERMTLRLPRAARPRGWALRERLRAHPLLAYLLANRLVELRFVYRDPPAGRKLPALIDRRDQHGRPAAGRPPAS